MAREWHGRLNSRGFHWRGHRLLVRRGLIEPVPRRRRREDYRWWERPGPMQLWQLEVMGGMFLASGAR